MKEENYQQENKDHNKENKNVLSKENQPLSTEGQIVIEEKQSKPNGEVCIIQYIRGNFLGKVLFHY
jgi:hypothetical protein